MASSLPVVENPPAFGASFDDALLDHGHGPLVADAVTTLQINVGKLCNQACHHCHVEAGPKRTEIMTAEVADRVIALMHASPAVTTVDITGGAPELNPSFRRLVAAARASGRTVPRKVIDRCNLTVLFEPGQADLAAFLAEHRVHVIASLPCYGPKNVDEQRGKGVFEKSIAALRRLNELGYGRTDTGPDDGLQLDLVYNPVGAYLPPSQPRLEADYKQRLGEDHGIVFHRLYTLTNMPIRRFAHYLAREGKWEAYMRLLVQSFNPGTLGGLMCRSHVSVGHDGKLYDCDFNQMLDLGLGAEDGRAPAGAARATGATVPTGATIWDIDSLSELHHRRIATDGHCFGCTAGAGSSCGGALAT
jgi:radical SAM/Cys-rich protein